MTSNEYISLMDKKLQAIVAKNIPLALAVSSTMGLQSKRIFTEGKNSDGSVIGTYSKDPVYISVAKSPKKFTPKGKDGKTKKKNGSQRKSGYFQNYLAYKKTIGLNQSVDSIDLVLSRKLLKDWCKSASVGAARATKINNNEYIVTLAKDSLDKVEKYNVTDLTKDERKKFFEVINFELKKALA